MCWLDEKRMVPLSDCYINHFIAKRGCETHGTVLVWGLVRLHLHNNNKHSYYAGTNNCFTHLRALLVLQAPRHCAQSIYCRAYLQYVLVFPKYAVKPSVRSTDNTKYYVVIFCFHFYNQTKKDFVRSSGWACGYSGSPDSLLKVHKLLEIIFRLLDWSHVISFSPM